MLEGRVYVPLLHARLAEIRALRELPDSSKNLMVPIVKLRPWLTSKSLERALEVVEQAVGNRLYGLDLDESKFDENPDPDKPARVEFCALFDSTDAFRNYYDLVECGPNRVPVFRDLTSQNPQIDDQLDQVEELERGLFVRAFPGQPGSLLQVADEILARGIENTVFILDCGWGRDILTQTALCAGVVQNLVDRSEQLEIVIAGSSFPNSFTGIGERAEFVARERNLFQEVRRLVNGGNLTYGDWGSTRPPSDPVPMRNIPRIDLARPNDWVCLRSEEGEEYEDIAKRAIDDPAWDGELGIWGEYMIESTAEGSEGSIRSPAMAAAVRVNLHLHQQANYDNPNGLHVGDEVIGDDL